MTLLSVGAVHLRARAWLLCSSALLALHVPQSVLAREKPSLGSEASDRGAFRSAKLVFEIAAGPLEAALQKWADTSKLKLLAPSQHIGVAQTDGLSGVFTPEEALKKLLLATPLKFELTGPKSVAVYDPTSPMAARAQATSSTLPTITVQRTTAPQPAAPPPAPVASAANPNTTMALPPAFPGGQVAVGGRVGILGNLDFMSTPFNTTSFTNEFTRDIEATSVSDVLRYSPSVVAAAAGPNAITDVFYVRGFWGLGTNFDGLPGLEFRQTQLEPIERVELLLGPSAFIYGQPGAVGGTMNLVPKRAGNEPLTSIGTRFISRQNFGAFADIGRRYGDNKEFGIRVNAAAAGGETMVSDTHRWMDIASVALDYRGQRFRWTFDFINLNRDVPAESWFDLDVGVPVPRVKDAAREFAPKWIQYEAASKLAMTRAEFDLSDQWTVSAAYGRTWMQDHRVTQVYTITDSAGTLDPIYYGASDYRGKFNNFSGEAILRGKVATGPFLHRFRFGASQFGGDATFAAEFVPGTGPTNIYAPTFPPKPYIPPAVLPPHKLDDTTTTTYFVSDQIGIWDDRVQVFVGARKVQFDSNSYDGMTGLPTGGYKADVTTPAYALVVKPTSWLSLYANYVEALEPGFRVDPQSGAANAGELLPPGQSLQKEVGAKVDFGRIAATVSLFDIERPSIFRDPVTNIEGYNGRQRNKGLELNVFGEPIKGLRVLGGASFIDARLTKTEGGLTDGNRPSGVPEVIYVGHLDWDVPYVSGMAMRFGALHTGSVFADFDNTNRQPVEAWTRYDFGVRYDVKYPTHRVVYRLNVDNLFDKRYFQVERATLYSGVGRYYTLSATAYF